MSRYIDESIKSLIYDLETEAKSSHDDDPDNEYLDGYFDGLHHAAKELSTAPTVDAVPVVRCRKCERWTNPIPIEMKEEGYGYCGVLWTNTHENEYCAWGERKTDGGIQTI